MLEKFARLMRTINKNLLAATIITGCCVSTTAQALPFNQVSQVYFFGDSLTDSGFNDLWSYPEPLPVGKAPTFTTFGGYTWSQYIARDVKGYVLPVYSDAPGLSSKKNGKANSANVTTPNPPDTITNNSIETIPLFVSGTLKGIDYAAAGSTTNGTGVGETWAPSLVQQINFFLASNPVLDPNALYFVWSGNNDILGLLESSPLPTEIQLLLAARVAAVNIANEVAVLTAHGARRVVVMSMPNLGVVPLINEAAASTGMPGLPAMMKNISFTFNSMLNTALGDVIATYGTKVLFEDVYDLLDNAILATEAGQPFVVSGESFLFVNATDPACSTVPESIYCPSTAPNNYIFADTLHPTGMAHRMLSLQVETDILNWQ